MGADWQHRIDETLDAVTLLLVIITPGLLRSPACRAEVGRFLERERELGQADLFLPVYYISAWEIDDPVVREGDELAQVLTSRQLADWRSCGLSRSPLRWPAKQSPNSRPECGTRSGSRRSGQAACLPTSESKLRQQPGQPSRQAPGAV